MVLSVVHGFAGRLHISHPPPFPRAKKKKKEKKDPDIPKIEKTRTLIKLSSPGSLNHSLVF